jgi:hypothetical protein
MYLIQQRNDSYSRHRYHLQLTRLLKERCKERNVMYTKHSDFRCSILAERDCPKPTEHKSKHPILTSVGLYVSDCLSVTTKAVMSHFHMALLSSECSANNFQDIKKFMVLTNIKTDNFEISFQINITWVLLRRSFV